MTHVKKLEYLIEEFTVPSESSCMKSVQDFLNKRGAEGWELAQEVNIYHRRHEDKMLSVYECVFKREIT
jgi:hypothetical protein